MAEGRELADAVLKVVHGLIRCNPDVANEFLGHFLIDLSKLGKFSMSSSSRLRRFLDTGDLVHSVIGDLWNEIPALEFESRAQFLQLFSQRIRWKATDNARKLGSKSRREELRVFVEPEDLQRVDETSDVSDDMIRAEEHDLFVLTMLKLKKRDQKLLAMRLNGYEISEIAQAFSMEYDSARKALSRAVSQVRGLIADQERGTPGAPAGPEDDPPP